MNFASAFRTLLDNHTSVQEQPRPARPQLKLHVGHIHAARSQSLHGACQLLADGVDDFQDYIEAYIEEVPPSRNCSSDRDIENFLDWLSHRDDLTLEQLDYIVCQRAGHAVQFEAICQRIAHSRFQALWKDSHDLLAELGRNRCLRIHLNPVHVWTVLETHAFLDESQEVPAIALFFAVDSQIQSIVMDEQTRDLLQLLLAGPQFIRRLPSAELCGAELCGLITELVNLGVVALSN